MYSLPFAEAETKLEYLKRKKKNTSKQLGLKLCNVLLTDDEQVA